MIVHLLHFIPLFYPTHTHIIFPYFVMPHSKFPCLSRTCGRKVAKGIECVTCKRWAHPKCSGVEPEHYAVYASHRWLDWVCDECKKNAREAFLLKANTSAVKGQHMKSVQQSKSTYAEVARPKSPSPKAVKTVTPITYSAEKQGRRHRVIQPKRKAPPYLDDAFSALTARVDLLSQALSDLKLASKSSLSKTRTLNVLILNQAEPFIREARARRDMDRRRARDLLRAAGLSPKTALIRVHRVGKWKDTKDGKVCRSPRPLLIQFKFQGDRDKFLAKSELLSSTTGGQCKIVPDEPRRVSGAYANFAVSNRQPRTPRKPRTLSPPAFGFLGCGQTHTLPIHPQEAVKQARVLLEDIRDDAQVSTCQDQDDVESAFSGICDNHGPLRISAQIESGDLRRRSVLPSCITSTPKNLGAPRTLRPRVKQD